MEQVITNKKILRKKKTSKLISFFKDIKEEYYKISWLNRKDLIKQMIIVLSSGTILTICISLFDTFMKFIVNLCF